MDKNNISGMPDENKIEEMLTKIQPVPSENFRKKMEQAAWRTENFGFQAKSRSSQRVRLALAMTTLFLLTGLLISPQGRAWAQEIFQFFKKVNSTTIQLPDSWLKWMEDIDNPYELPLVPVLIPTVSTEMAVLPGCETAQKSQSYDCQVALAESQLEFDLKELPAKPEDWEFEVLRFDATPKSATIGYSFDFRYNSYSTLYLFQGLGNFPEFYTNSPWAAVPAEKVEIVKVGSYNGEYVKGSFRIPTGSSNLVWSDSRDHQRLAWSDGTRWYLIELWGNLNVPDTMGRDGLIKLAASLVASPLEKPELLNPDFLYSISDAEKVSGLDLKAPAVLPIEVSFSYARYYVDSKEVRLFYGMNEELIIYEWMGKSLDLATISKTSNPDYEIVEVNSEKAFYGSVGGGDPHLFLWWEEDGLYYQMYYYEIIGAKLDKEKMIAIAESMQDIDDFRTKDSKPYEYVSIYAQALGFDPMEFPTTPNRWSYSNVWGDAQARCIGLVYTSTTEQGVLYIGQCRTDKRFNISDVPASSIERVRIAGNQGQYVVGDFVTGNNGEMIWDPAAPTKQLYWQEDGLWIQMTLTGKSAILHNKEDLISYADSLR